MNAIDIDRLIERFGSFLFRSPLRWFHPEYYKDKRAVLRTTRANILPASLTNDLIKAREVLRMQKRLEPGRVEAKALLERYDHEYETDFECVSRAAEVATEVFRLSGTSCVPAGLVNGISFGTVSPPQIPVTGKRILDAVSKWEELAPRLASLIALDDLHKANRVVHRRRGLDAGRDQVKALLGQYDNAYETDFDAVGRALKVAADAMQLAGQLPIPTGLVRLITQPTTVTSDLVSIGSRILDSLHAWEASAGGVNDLIPEVLPSTSLSLAQSSLADVEQWAQSLLSPLAMLCELVDVVLAFHKRPSSADLSGLYEDLGKNEELLAIQAHINAEAERLRRVFGKRFRDIDTAWTHVQGS